MTGSEVDDFDLFDILLVFQKDVFGLEIAVDDSLLVAVSHGRHELLENQGRRALGEVVLLHYKVEKFSA